ncbi:MAG: cache domain-containing protein [Verrucomicrobiales bacterium]
MFSSLRSRLIILLLIAAVPAFALMIFSSLEWREQDAKLVRENTLRLSTFVANNLDRDFTAVRSFLHSLTNYPGVLEKDPVATKQLFERLAPEKSFYVNIGLIDTNGNLISSSRALPGENVQSAGWFQELLGGKAFAVSSHFIYPTNLSTVHVGVPLKSGNEISAILFLSMGTAWISELAKEADLPEGAALTLTDKNGAVLARHPEPEKYLGTIQNWGTNAVMQGRSGFVNAVGLDGVKRLYAYHTLEESPLTVRIGMASNAVYKAADRVMYRNLIILGFTTLVSLLLAWYGAHVLFLRPVQKLVVATRRVAQGDINTRVDLPETGELGQLGASFNAMTEALEWRDAQLREADLDYGEILNQIDERNPSLEKNKGPKKQGGSSGGEDDRK